MLHAKKKLFCLFVDYNKAFDLIWRDALWYKLDKCGVTENTKIFKVVKNMYSNIKSCIFLNGKKSEFFASTLGVRQGENLSPLLFSLFVNDLELFLSSNGCNALRTGCDIENYVKLLLFMYADDTVLFANDEESLQKALDTLSDYCKHWKLKVNSKKTKVVIFGKTRYRKDKKFVYEGVELEVTDTYKYLGILFNYNGSFKIGMKELFEQSSKAMFSLMSKCRTLNLPIDIQLDLFDKTVVPIITYGCEVWGYEKLDLIEKLHVTYCKRILQLRKNTGHMFIYGELGRYPLSIVIKSRIISYWIRMITSKDCKLNVIIYKTLLDLYNQGKYKSMWLMNVKHILDTCGMSNLFNNPLNVNAKWLKLAVERKLQDQFFQLWQENMANQNLYVNYRSYKNTLSFEPYIVEQPYKLRRMITMFKCSNHNLAVEVGRHSGLDRAERFCRRCDLNTMGDEYHLVMECTNVDIVRCRKQFLPKYCHSNPSMFKYVNFMNSVFSDKTLCSQFGGFLKKVLFDHVIK